MLRLLLALAAISSILAHRAHAQPRRPQVIELDEIIVEADVQRPRAFYVLSRSAIGAPDAALRTSFVRGVIQSVHRAPF